jgi:hypothetical protein
MAIRDTQKNLIKEQVLQEKLREGLYPSVLLVEQLADEAFKERPAGTPRFSFQPMVKGEASSVEVYNTLFDEIGLDLTVGFAEVRHLNNRLMSLSQYYESNRIRVDKELQGIELKSKAIQMKSEAKTNTEVVGDTINNFLAIDFKGDDKRNIPRTDAFVNLKFGEVEMTRMRGSTFKHDLSQAKVNFTSDDDLQIINLTPLRSALTDTIYDSWRSIVVSKEQKPVHMMYTLELIEEVHATSVSIDTQVGKPVYVTLMVSSDNNEWTTYERRRVVNGYQWSFDRRSVKYIIFLMEKKEEDRPNAEEFEYLFGAKNIQVTEQRYVDKSYFVSKPFALPDHEGVESIKIDTTDYLPPDTNIRYYVGFDYDTNVIEWQEISENRPVVTEMVKPYKMEINRFTPGYGDLMAERYGQRFHRIAKLPYKPLKKSMKLLIGRNMWLRETMPVPFTYEETGDGSDGVVYQTGVHDWVRAGTAKKDYIRIQNRFDYLQQDRFHRYTTNIFIDDPETYRSIIRSSENASHAVFLNGSRVKPIADDYFLSFKKGWNQIIVYAYSRDENEELLLDFYVPKMSNRIFANRYPLEQVSVYDMLNNTSSRMHGRFTVDDDNNIIVNYHPKTLDIQNTLQRGQSDARKEVRLSEGIEYSLEYKYSLSDITEHKIRLMAILSKERELIQTTPRLKDYKLIIE